MKRDPNPLGIRSSSIAKQRAEPCERERTPQHAALLRRAGAVGVTHSDWARLRSGRRAPLSAPVSAGRILSFALCAGAAVFVSACAGDPSCEESRTCAAGAIGTGGKTTTDASTGGRTGVGTGGASGASGTGGSTGSGGAGGNAGSEGGAGAAGADGSDAGDGGGEAEAGPTCSGTVGSREEGCPIEDPEGFFVSRAGNASNADGSRAHPFTTIIAAINAASPQTDAGPADGGSSTTKRIYVCADAGEYAETLQLNASRDGLAFYGGFRCADWKYAPTVRTKLASPGEIAWTMSGIAKGVTVEDFDVRSADATLSTTSSIAMIVTQSSKNVVLRRMTITAGKGSDGTRGSNGNNGADGIVVGPEQAGKPAVCVNPPTSQYPGYWNRTLPVPYGGNGGAGWLDMNGDRGVRGGPIVNVTPPDVDNGGAGATTLGTDGTKGGGGSRGNDGAAASSFPMNDGFGPTGYTTGGGASGVDGYAGQGGGGGGASKGSTTCAAPSGGAGGVGGTGGKHGTGGRSGGVSVALWVWNSAVTISDVTLVSSNGGSGGDGGNGGVGGKGQVGAPGGAGNTTNGIGAAGAGGKGGDGGNGGAGAGGNGGHSYPLVFHGAAPTKTGVIYTPGQPGLPGGGGLTGAVRAPNGNDGEAAAQHEVP
jgi:hypothetical protein